LRGKKKKSFLQWKEIKEFFDIFDIKGEREERCYNGTQKYGLVNKGR